MARLIWVLILLMPITGLAQRYKTVELKPIAKQGWQYYYDLKKVGTPLALEVPLLALNDEEVNKNWGTSKAFRSASALVSIAPLIYLVTIASNQTYGDPTTFWIIMGAHLRLS